jgi:hypothetical protein
VGFAFSRGVGMGLGGVAKYRDPNNYTSIYYNMFFLSIMQS